MKKGLKIFLLLFISAIVTYVTIVFLLCVGDMLNYQPGIKYHYLKNRKIQNVDISKYSNIKIDSDSTTKQLLQSDKMDDRKQIIDKAIDDCLKIVRKELSFSHTNDLPNGKANCVGYAQYYSALLNTYFKNSNIDAEADPVVGEIHYHTLFGNEINLNKILEKIVTNKEKNFVKDHDYVIINPKGKYEITPSFQNGGEDGYFEMSCINTDPCEEDNHQIRTINIILCIILFLFYWFITTLILFIFWIPIKLCFKGIWQLIKLCFKGIQKLYNFIKNKIHIKRNE